MTKACAPETVSWSVCANGSHVLLSLLLPVHVLTISHHILKLLLAGVLHHNHGADPENIGKPIEHNAVCWTVISPWKQKQIRFESSITHCSHISTQMNIKQQRLLYLIKGWFHFYWFTGLRLREQTHVSRSIWIISIFAHVERAALCYVMWSKTSSRGTNTKTVQRNTASRYASQYILLKSLWKHTVCLQAAERNIL